MKEFIQAKYHLFSKVASSVVHEMKNPLSAITLGLEYLQLQGGSGAVPSDVVRNISASTSKLNAMLEALHLLFIEDEGGRKGMVKISTVVEKARLLLNYFLARNHITLEVAVRDREPWILGDECQLLTLFFLILARYALEIGDGGGLEASIYMAEERLVFDLYAKGISEKGDGTEDETIPGMEELARANGAELETQGLGEVSCRLRFPIPLT